MVASCQPYAPAAFTPRNIPGIHFTFWSEGNMSLKNPVTSPGIDPGTVRLLVQRLNHYATPGPSVKNIQWLNSWYIILDISLVYSRSALNFRVSEGRKCVHKNPSLALTWAVWVQYTLSQTLGLRYTSILSSHVLLCFPSDFFSRIFGQLLDPNCIGVPHLSHTRFITIPYHHAYYTLRTLYEDQ